MKSRLLIKTIAVASIIVGATASYTSLAETVSQKEAKRIARLFFNDAYSKELSDPEYVYNGKRFVTDRLFTPFYIFNSPEGGFVIISAENKAFPILGYQLAAKGYGFPKNGHITTEQSTILRELARDIELIRFDSRYPVEAAAAWEDIAGTIHSVLYAESILAPGYFRFQPDDKTMWILRERSVEFPYEWPKTDLEVEAERIAAIQPDYKPFSFYDGFVAEVTREQEAKDRTLEERLNPSRPVVHNLGGGHFQIDMPADVRSLYLYNAEGALMLRNHYKGGRILPVDLSILPNGFYFARILTADGLPFGLKLHR